MAIRETTVQSNISWASRTSPLTAFKETEEQTESLKLH